MTSFTHQDLQTWMDAPPSYEELFGPLDDEENEEQQTPPTEVSEAVAEFHALEESENKRLRYNQSLVVDTRAKPPEAPHFLVPDLRPWMRREGGPGEGENTSVTEIGAKYTSQRPRMPSALYGFRRENERTISSVTESPSNRSESMSTDSSQASRIESRTTASSRTNPTRGESRSTGSNIQTSRHMNIPRTSQSVNQSGARLTGRRQVLVDTRSSSLGSINGQGCRELRFELPRRYTLMESLFSPVDNGPAAYRKAPVRIRGKDHPRGCTVD